MSKVWADRVKNENDLTTLDDVPDRYKAEVEGILKGEQ
jgi:hypothetical protein